ncbi:MAG: Metallophosphoesterase family protein [Bacteroidota bacterium]|nr:Metallophosphoesterase family protein [Bacteroidota bacterium]
MKKIKVYLVLLFAALYCTNAKILMQPYLQALVPGGVCIMVESDTKIPIKVEYGSQGALNKTAGTNFYVQTDKNEEPTYVHRIYLSGLDPYTTYKYRASQGDESKTENYSFRSAPSYDTPYKLAVMGDCRSNTKVHGEIAKKILQYEPSFSIYTGDLCYNSSYEKYKSEFFIENELELSARVPFFNAVGNHEAWKENTKAFTQAPSSLSGAQDYYSFDMGYAHFLILSTETTCCKGSEQYKFIEEDLKQTKAKWIIAAFHESAYCYGGHGDNSMMKKVSEELFVKYHVNLVVTGHSHFYQHNIVDGIHHITMAGGGAPLYNPETSKYTVKSAKEHHFGIVEMSAALLKLTVYSLEGKIIDQVEITK